MSRLPDTIQLGPHTYTVKCVGGRDVPLGEIDNVNLDFKVDPAQSISQMRDTILHELLHGLLDMIGVGERLGLQQLLDHDQEERLVRSLSPWLLDTLRRNPQLVEFLCG